MGSGTKENPYTREDVLKRIKENGGTAKGLDLSEKVFEEEIDLCDLNLKGIILNEAVLFGAKFNGSDLAGAKLRNATLIRAKFNQYDNKPFPKFAHLRDADLSSADLSEAEFIGAFLNNTNFRGAKLPDANFTIEGRRTPDLLFTDFREADLFSSDFTGRSFHFTKLEGAYINWAKITEERTFLGDADWGNYIIGEEKPRKDFYTAEHLYRQLKIWYKQHGYNDTAAKFYYREKEASRKGARHRNDRAAGWLSWAVFGHGEGWKRIPIWMVGFILLFALTYCAIGSVWGWSAFGNSLYFSAVSFTALGYGSWVQATNGWIKGIGAFESLVGVSMMALLLVTFVRKWTR